MGIYGNYDKLTLLEYCINNETRQINSMLPSLNEITSINEGHAWDAIKTVFGKIKKFFEFIKEKITLVVNKATNFLKRIGSKDKRKPLDVNYRFTDKEKELAEEIHIEYTSYDVRFIIDDLKDYLKEINSIWDAFLDVAERRIHSKNYSEMQKKVEDLSPLVKNLESRTKGLKDKYTSKTKKIDEPCITGLGKAATLYNTWIYDIDGVISDIKLHCANLENSKEDLDKSIKDLDSSINKYNTNNFKDDLGNDVNLKDNLILFYKIEVYITNLASCLKVGYTYLESLDEEISAIGGRVQSSLTKIRYHAKMKDNAEKEKKDDNKK